MLTAHIAHFSCCELQEVADKTKRFEFLLRQTELFSHFVESGHSAKEFKSKGTKVQTETPRKVYGGVMSTSQSTPGILAS